MHRRLIRSARVALAALLLVLVAAVPALAADHWTDISDAAWQKTYGLSAAQVATVAQGYADGTFHPSSPVIRAQFAKMVVSAFDLKTTRPAAPTFSDVSPPDFYYPWIEGGVAAGIIAKSETYRPLAATKREEASAIVAASLVQEEISLNGAINGKTANYPSLAAWYAADGDSVLRYFKDEGAISGADAAAVAYLVFHQVMHGTARNGYLYVDPKLSLTRAQAVAFILRSEGVQLEAAAPSPPQITGLGPVEGLAAGGAEAVIVGSGFRDASSVSFGRTVVPKAGFTIDSDNQITVKAVPAGSGTVDVKVTTLHGANSATSSDKYSYLSTLTGGDKAVAQAVTCLGVPYVWAGASPFGFDCSGLVMYVFRKLGVALPHSSLLQSSAGSRVNVDQLLPGDLLFFYSPVSHVGIYVGNGNMIDAPRTGAFVRIEKAWTSNLTGARRIFLAP